MGAPIIVISGRLGKDPEVYKENAVKFSVAVTINKDKTDWYNCITWDTRTKEMLTKYFKKGYTIIVTGGQTLADAEGKGKYVNITAYHVDFGPATGVKKEESTESSADAGEFGELQSVATVAPVDVF
jgi:single-stranded DNA-binding protein